MDIYDEEDWIDSSIFEVYDSDWCEDDPDCPCPGPSEMEKPDVTFLQDYFDEIDSDEEGLFIQDMLLYRQQICEELWQEFAKEAREYPEDMQECLERLHMDRRLKAVMTVISFKKLILLCKWMCFKSWHFVERSWNQIMKLYLIIVRCRFVERSWNQIMKLYLVPRLIVF